MAADTSALGFEPIKMPAIAFSTYARESGVKELENSDIYKDDVIVFTGASSTKLDVARQMHRVILDAGGMRHPENANNQFFPFRSISPFVAGVIVPRDQLDTCMRAAEIEEVPNMVALQGKLAKAVKAREEDFAEARAAVEQLQAHEERAREAAAAPRDNGKGPLHEFFRRLDAAREASATKEAVR